MLKSFFILVFLFCIGSLAHASGELLAGGYYMDDMGQTVSPKIGVAAHSDKLGNDWHDALYFGVGNIQQPSGANGFYQEFTAGLSYSGFADGLSVGVGAGIIGNRAAYGSLDDHVHVTVGYKLW